MHVRDCIPSDARTATTAQTIREAAQMMKELDTGFLPVGENDRLVGMVTDRDIAIRAVAEGKSFDTKVREVMTPEVHYVFDDETVDDAAEKMSDLQVRRLPVLTRNKRLMGVISLGDLTRSGIDQRAAKARGGVFSDHRSQAQG